MYAIDVWSVRHRPALRLVVVSFNFVDVARASGHLALAVSHASAYRDGVRNYSAYVPN